MCFCLERKDSLMTSSSLQISAEENFRVLQTGQAQRPVAPSSVQLSGVLDDLEPLKALAQLAVPSIADCCAVHLLKPDGTFEWVAGAVPILGSERQDLATVELLGVLASGQSTLVTRVAGSSWAQESGLHSYMIVPLKTTHQTLGAILFAMVESQRVLDEAALAVAENLASHVAVYLDTALQLRKSHALNVELGQRVNEHSAKLRTAIAQVKQSDTMIRTLYRISNHLNSTLDIETILDQLAQEAIRIVGGESGFAGLATADGMKVQKYFNKGKPEPFEHHWTIGQGVPGWVLKNKTTYVTNNPGVDPQVEQGLLVNRGARSLICAPIVNSVGVVLAYLAVSNKKRGTKGFTSFDQTKLLSLVPVASIAIQNAVAFEQRTAGLIELGEAAQQLRDFAANLESAREQERIRIARDLHDELGQALTTMKFDLSWLTGRLVDKDMKLASQAKQVTDQMDQMVKMVRRICTELRPGVLEDLGLSASLEWAAMDFEKNTGIGCTVSSIGESLIEQNLPVSAALAIYRIFQEALTNVARHSGARNVEVKVTITPQEFVLLIQDDGRGISNQELTGRKTLGLLGMRERAQRLGGRVMFSGSAEGTLVSVLFPMENKKC